MSGIYIHGAQFPSNCRECKLCKPYGCVGDCYCMWLGEYFTNNVKPPYKERPDECPLIPVPDHGRLIDADKIGLTDFEIIMCQQGNPHKNALESLLEKLEKAPTVIPTDKEVPI